MNLKELIDTISQETTIPAGQVRKVSTAILEKFSDLIEKQENFRSPIVNLNSVTVTAKKAKEKLAGRPIRKMAKMEISPKKTIS
jgi:nucleoid DNA-binding protein